MSKKNIDDRKIQQKEILNNLDKNRRITNTRLDIIECLSDGQHQHTAADIVNHLKQKYDRLNIATVYNNLKALLAQGVIDVYPNYDSQNQRYELINKDNFHIHLRNYMSGSEEHIDIPDNIINEINDIISARGYNLHNLKIEVIVKNKDK